MQYIFVSCTVCVLISANAAIAKYLDYKHFIVLQSCYGGVTGCDVTQKSATTKIKTGLDLFFFLAGLSHVATLFFFLGKPSRTVTPPQLATSGPIFFLAGVTRGNFCAERTLSRLNWITF